MSIIGGEKMKKKTVHAVHESDLDVFLTSLGLQKDLQEGKLMCFFCKEKITRENLGSIIPKGKNIEVCCKSLRCYTRAMFQEEGIKE